MNHRYKKALITSALVAIVGVQNLSAAQINNCADWNPCCFDYGLNPPPTCPTCCGCTWYGEIDYLYWKPYVENASPCTVVKSDHVALRSQDTNSTSNTSTRNKDFPFDWDSGYRVALGYGFPCDKWGLALTWSHYRTDAFLAENGFAHPNSATKVQFVDDFSMPLIGFVDDAQAGLIDLFTSASLASKWAFQFNQVDLDFFRDFYVGCSLSLKPYIGLRALFINHTIHTHTEYSQPQNIPTSAIPFNSITDDQRLHSNLKSFGLKGGLESFWEVTCGLGVYGNVGASLIYANYENGQKLQQVRVLENNQTRLVDNIEANHCYQSLKMMSDLSIGIQWRQPINCNQNLVFIKAGWEHHMLLQGSQFPTIKTDVSIGSTSFFTAHSSFTRAGDISLYGFVFSFGLSF